MLKPVSIFLIVLGAVLAFALRWEPRLLDFDAIGWVFMLVGILGLILHRYVLRRRLDAASTARPMAQPLYDQPRYDQPRYDQPGAMPTDPRDPRADD